MADSGNLLRPRSIFPQTFLMGKDPTKHGDLRSEGWIPAVNDNGGVLRGPKMMGLGKPVTGPFKKHGQFFVSFFQRLGDVITKNFRYLKWRC